MAEKTYLDLEEVNALLPEHLKINTKDRIERSIYATSEGKLLPVLNSKLYPDNYFWYSSITHYFKKMGAEYICFSAGLMGIFVIPTEIVVHYNKFSGWKGEGSKGRQFHVRIKAHENGTFTFWNFNDPKENIDITQYFIKVGI